MISVKSSDLDDLTDLTLFAAIVEHGGLNAASRHLAIPKSRLSRHLAALEERYGVQLLHRSTRRFGVTDLGQALYDQCTVVLENTQAARALMTNAQAEPHGALRVSAPSPLANFWLAPLLPRFLQSYPTLNLELESGDRNIDMLADRIDVAIHIRPMPLEDSDLVIRHLGISQQVLVAAPALLAGQPALQRPDDLLRMPLIGFCGPNGRAEWQLDGDRGQRQIINFVPRLATFELVVLRTAVLDGLGVGLLPAHFCREAIEHGLLTPILPGWRGPLNNIHAAYLSRRGLSTGARAFLDFLIRELPRGDAQ